MTPQAISIEEIQSYIGGLWLENKFQANKIRELEAEIERLKREIEKVKKPPEGG